VRVAGSGHLVHGRSSLADSDSRVNEALRAERMRRYAPRMSQPFGAEQDDRVNRAAEMVSEQAHCSLPEALLLMEARAEESGNSIEDIAREVVEREISFDA
jgi:AmiR/NasT family two-component response regulator